MVEHVIGNDGVASPILASGTIKKASLAEAFLMVVMLAEGWTCAATSGDRAGRSSARESEQFLNCEAVRLRCAPPPHELASGTIFENRLNAGGFCVVRVASHKVRLFRSLKQRLFINYRIFNYKIP